MSTTRPGRFCCRHGFTPLQTWDLPEVSWLRSCTARQQPRTASREERSPCRYQWLRQGTDDGAQRIHAHACCISNGKWRYRKLVALPLGRITPDPCDGQVLPNAEAFAVPRSVELV